MKRHRYRITLERLASQNGSLAAPETLQFEVGNHDDIFAIVEKICGRDDFDKDSATALAVGLKLFSEVMLENKEHPMFSSFQVHFAEFMKELKKSSRSTSIN